MNLTPESFFALQSGRPSGATYPLTVHELGNLMVPNGLVEVSDPFVSLAEADAIAVPAGTYPVRVTLADVSTAQDGSHVREAYLSLVIAEGAVAQVRAAIPEGTDPAPAGSYYCVGVDAGTVCFADATAVRTLMPGTSQDWYDNIFDTGTDSSWFSLMDNPEHIRDGAANIVLPLATGGENVILVHSGWGDGSYPIVTTHDASGALLGLHIDLLVAVAEDLAESK